MRPDAPLAGCSEELAGQPGEVNSAGGLWVDAQQLLNGGSAPRRLIKQRQQRAGISGQTAGPILPAGSGQAAARLEPKGCDAVLSAAVGPWERSTAGAPVSCSMT